MNVRLFKVKKFQRPKGDRGTEGQRFKGLVDTRSNASIEVLIE